MKIVSLAAENIKRLVAVEIKPEHNIVEITGRNGQGKTSILDAIFWALDGNKAIQSKPVREGADSGYIRLDLGDYIVTKKFKVKDDGDITISLTVENPDGAKYGSPQELLNKFLGDLTFDPLAFARMKPRDQVMALRGLVKDYDFDAAEKRSKQIFADRTDVNRTVRDLKAQIDAIPLPEGDTQERVDVTALMQELEAAMDANTRTQQAIARRDNLEGDIVALQASIESKRQEIRALENAIRHNELQIEECRDLIGDIVVGDLIDIEPISAKLRSADEVNAIAARVDESKRLKKQLQDAEAKSREMTKQLDDIASTSAAAVRAANLPIDGLELTEEEVLLNSVPFSQASDAEQLRASVAIAGAMNPTLRVIRVRDGSLLDSDSMSMLTRYAEESEYQIWVETVMSGRETAIVIEAGEVAAHKEAAE